MERSPDRLARRIDFLAGAAAAGASLAGLALGWGGTVRATTGNGNAPSIQAILDTALMAEQLAMTFYYTGLTTPAVMRDHRLAGPSANPHNPGLPPGGTPSNVKDMQAILDSEVKHAQALLTAGAASPHSQFYFPATTFMSLGTSTQAGTFLGVLDALETAFVGAYLAALDQLLGLGRPDLAGVIVQIMGVEAEHRMLGRLISGYQTPNNLTLQKNPFSSVAAAARALQPFVTGHGFAQGPTPPIPLPAPAHAERVVGMYATHIVTHFL